MAIAHVQSGTAFADGAASVSRAYSSNVTSGNLLIIAAAKFRSGTADAFVVGDCTKTAGTATIGSIQLDQDIEVQYETSTERIQVGIWSVLCTGTGSATFQVATGGAGDFWMLCEAEYSGSWDASRLEDTAEAATGTDNTSAASGNADSAGAALFFGVLMTTNNGGTVTITEDGAYTLIAENEDDNTHACGSFIYRLPGSTTTDSADWTITSNRGWACGLAVYKEVAGGGGGASGIPVARIKVLRPRAFAPGRAR